MAEWTIPLTVGDLSCGCPQLSFVESSKPMISSGIDDSKTWVSLSRQAMLQTILDIVHDADDQFRARAVNLIEPNLQCHTRRLPSWSASTDSQAALVLSPGTSSAKRTMLMQSVLSFSDLRDIVHEVVDSIHLLLVMNPRFAAKVWEREYGDMPTRISVPHPWGGTAMRKLASHSRLLSSRLKAMHDSFGGALVMPGAFWQTCQP